MPYQFSLPIYQVFGNSSPFVTTNAQVAKTIVKSKQIYFISALTYIKLLEKTSLFRLHSFSPYCYVLRVGGPFTSKMFYAVCRYKINYNLLTAENATACIFYKFWYGKNCHITFNFAEMKLVAFILAVMVLVLSCIPCMDRESMTYSKGATPQFSKATNHQENSDTDSCSPFCSCNCCTGFTFKFQPYQLVELVLLKAEKGTFILPSKISNIALPIWQPPQLV